MRVPPTELVDKKEKLINFHKKGNQGSMERNTETRNSGSSLETEEDTGRPR